ncbi:MAG: FHA domain-containing protein, partial [Ardenticatenales bacterium]|nr:FHA domain-containing protein [Ardenticatenales bacterium]
MPRQGHLEIIEPSGNIRFHDLDPDKGITNIGRHPENDIIIDSPGVASFHAVLDHRQKPYQITLLSQAARASVAGETLTPNISKPVQEWDAIQIDGHAIILLEDNGSNGGPIPAPARPMLRPSPPAAPLQLLPLPAATYTAPATYESDIPEIALFSPQRPDLTPAPSPLSFDRPSLASRPADETNEIIISDLSAREWVINVEETATFQVSLANGGDIVATFLVQVEGIEESWITISHPRVNLNEGERTTVTISLTPPRLSTSWAGDHHFSVIVSSPNHPGLHSKRGATLTINPYYEFAVGELSPKQQTISWRQRQGMADFPIANKGNSNASFKVEAIDEERACTFEFQVPGEEVVLAGQAEFELAPDEVATIPVVIIPRTRQLILRKRTYSFTITADHLLDDHTARTVLGQLTSKPLIALWMIVLFALLVALFIVLLFRPSINSVFVSPTGNPVLIREKEDVKISWEASYFTDVVLESIDVADGTRAGVNRSPERIGSYVVNPENSTDYEVRAENWLSKLIPYLQPEPELVHVVVDPYNPKLRDFRVSANNIQLGESVVVSWETLDATEKTLFVNDVAQTLTDDRGSLTFDNLTSVTTFSLKIANRYLPNGTTQSHIVNVVVPTLTPTPTLT